MAVRPIRLFGDPILRTPAEPVTDFDRQLRRLVRDLTDTMLDAPGRGLAAPQIGVGLRVFTYQMPDAEPAHLVNPVLRFPDDEDQFGEEGCLSVPGLPFDCLRRRNVVATGYTMDGEPLTVEGSDLLARVIQHETDHLDGIVFIDRLDPETKKAALRAIREADWYGQPVPRVKESPHRMLGAPR